ncbi:NADH dehydrogenase [ubiquinone] 1 alpha subcomplex subunit 8 [Strongylocentrotus purpuratus]|uniref:NADH dehydrogenase [ubiquinone] 1 alpha subcomplex subunit 8 n=1 Tax=Strongylocentrotus purpuratus TaxID=7668 RepID=A0A7M7GGU2_STRPU|nr:NADH dehydrogenase [ubiquinone] 1 alpha subcomplex subunit 8 [Strongylocentrotus purpuratus]|eukprot:XP_003728171.1 PREDICTED: NADH dehydrogenase [ubiquinone] 1 alpha subcomplex subunit 8 isoform X2 [Strongylocentrotus purpuratus]
MPEVVNLPSKVELDVPEVPLTSSALKAGAHHFGRQCDKANKEFMLCREEEKDPRKCLEEGRQVTACSFKFFNQIRTHCNESFTEHWTCLDYNKQEFRRCRQSQKKFDTCVFENLGWVRPELGDLGKVTVVKTERPVPEFDLRPIPEPTPRPIPPANLPASKTGSKYFFFW